MKQFLIIILTFFILFFQLSCVNNRSASETGSLDTTTLRVDTTTMRETLPPKTLDKHTIDYKRSAVFGYSFFKNIRQNETRKIDAFVSVINPISKVIDTLKEINAAYIPERTNDTATVFAKNIMVYKSLDIQLYNAGDSDFIIRAYSERNQEIDSLDGNSWSWTVTPRTDKKYGTLIMNVVAEKPDGSHEPFSTIQIPITISIDRAIDRSLWQWMMDNPEKVITIILIPFIIFFWKQITGLFRKKTVPPK
jgi:hypothetical protein